MDNPRWFLYSLVRYGTPFFYFVARANKKMSSLIERERIILQLARQRLRDYKIARKINTDPPSVSRSRKNAQKKLVAAKIDIAWAEKIGLPIIIS